MDQNVACCLLENQGWAKTWLGSPNQACRLRFFFLGPIPELFFCTFFARFPGNPSNYVDPNDPKKFDAFPGNSTNNVDKNPDLAFLAKPGMPSLGSCPHYLLNFLEMQQFSSGPRGRHYLRNFLEMQRNTGTKKNLECGPEKNLEPAGLVGDDMAFL